MEERTKLSHPIGYWYLGEVHCPFCFERQGRVDHEGTIPSDDLIGNLTRCFICDLPLWEIRRELRAKRRSRSTRSHEDQTSSQAIASRAI
jgi:hypothetical protein